MSGEPRRAPGPGWPDPGRPGWVTKTVRLNEKTLQSLKYQCALTPQLSENQVIGALISEANRAAEVRLHGALLEKYHAGKMLYKELQAIANVFADVRIEVGAKPSMAEVARLTAERIAKRKSEDQPAAE